MHFACASVCHHPKPTPAVRTDGQAIAGAGNSVLAAQRTTTRVPNDSAGSISGVPHARHIAPSTPHDTASSISRIPHAGPAARLSGGRGQGGGVSGGSSQTSEYFTSFPCFFFVLLIHIHCRFICMCPSTTATATALFCEACRTLLPSRHALKTLPPLPLLLLIPHPPGPSPLRLQLDKGLALTRPPVGSSQ